MGKFSDLSDNLRIDEHDLDNECMAQPQRFNDAAQESARAASRRDEAKDVLKTVEAEVEFDIRKKAEASGEKLTEPAVKAKVQLSARRQVAFKAYLEASLDADKWEALKESFKDRSFMVRELAGLWLAGYYAKNSVEGVSKQRDDVEYEARKKALADKRRVGVGRVRMKEGD